MPDDAAPPPPEEPWLRIAASPGLAAWLAEQRVSLAFSTYQTGKLFLVGLRPDGQLSVFERTFNRAMGLWAEGESLWLSTHYQLWRFENVLRPGQAYEGGDRLYVPRVGFTTGELDVHDVAVEAGGRVVFVATLFGCVATTHARFNFAPIWRPPFLKEFAAQDCCHLNGLALENGRLRYVTAVSTTPEPDSWRAHRRDGGCVLEVPSGRAVATGLSMPHSPRVHRGRLWVLNSGTGYLGEIDHGAGAFRPLAFCPGYLRGLAFAGGYAVVGLSRPRHEGTFGGLPLEDALRERGVEAWCGLAVIDLRDGRAAHWLRLEGMVTELYDVAVLPGAVRPLALGFKTDEIQRVVAAADPEPL